MKKFTFLFLALFLRFCIETFAQLNYSTGSVSGSVKDKKTDEPLVGASILIKGTNKGAVTDFDGKFQINGLPENIYTLAVSYISYKDSVFENVRVEKNKTIQVDIELKKSENMMETVNITATRNTGTERAVIGSIKSNVNIANGISNQQIRKSIDKDACEVIKRVPGITVSDDRFLIVRGLSQRYNNVWLNNNPVPSSETDIRAFSFDNIPATIIDNLLVFKTASPDLPADFSGGFVKIFTTGMPDKNSVSVSLGGGYRENTTFNDFYSDKKSKTDFAGFDNGMRHLPDNFPANTANISASNSADAGLQITKLGQSLNRNLTADKQTAAPDLKFAVSVSRLFKIKNLKAGNITSVNYGNTRETNRILNSHFSVYNFAEDKANPAFEFYDNRYSNSVKISVLNNFVIILNSKNKLEFRNLFNQFGQNKTTIREGIDYYSYQNIKGYEFHYTQRTIYTAQLAGEHSSGENSKLDWSAGYSLAKRSEPDIRRLTLIQESDPENPNYGKYSMWFNPYADPVYAGRRFLNTDENVFSLNTNYKTNISIFNLNIEIKTGVYFDYKNRKFQARNLGYAMSNPALFDSQIRYLPVEQVFADENINSTTGIKIDETTNKSDSYNASARMNAGYFSLKIPIGKKINILTGVRAEYNILEMNSFLTASNRKVKISTASPDIFPSLNVTYNINKIHLIRLAYGKSVNRPEFRELAPFFFVDFEQNAGIYGNPDLKNCYVNNYDLRYEIYPADNEFISFGLFYKDFTNPVETRFLESTPLQYSFQNAEKAKSSGIEIEMRKSLAFIPNLEKFSFIFNASLIKSEVIFKPGEHEKNRPMQGQSPYIFNAGLYRQNDKTKTSVSILYNIIGARIIAVGQAMQNTSEDIPELYEMPRHSLDIAINQKIGKRIEFKFGAKDVLNQPVVYKQTVEFEKEGKRVTRNQVNKKYYPGRYFSVGISIKL